MMSPQRDDIDMMGLNSNMFCTISRRVINMLCKDTSNVHQLSQWRNGIIAVCRSGDLFRSRQAYSVIIFRADGAHFLGRQSILILEVGRWDHALVIIYKPMIEAMESPSYSACAKSGWENNREQIDCPDQRQYS